MKLNSLEFWLMNSPIRKLIQLKVVLLDFVRFGKGLGGKQILEIGCGSGNGAILISKHFHPAKIYGIDIDEKMVEIANGRKLKYASFEVGNATELYFKDKTFDAVFDFAIIHHISNWKDCLGEIKRVLKRNGRVFIEDLSVETFQGFIGKLLRKFSNHPYSSMYTMEEFSNQLKILGFKIIDQKNHNFLGLLRYFTLIAIKE